MSFSMTFTEAVSSDEGQLSYSKEVTADLKIAVDVVVPDSTVDKEVDVALDYDKIQGIYIVSDQNLTLETNVAGTPVDTINLVANVPYVWHADSYCIIKFTADVTKIFLTNASGEEANFKMRVLVDSTPV
jgi:hypothetical protein